MGSDNCEDMEKLLSDNGLAPSKWIKIFQKQGLMTPVDVEGQKGDEGVYESLCINANLDEKAALRKILNLNIFPKDDIASCLARVGLDVQYWSKIFREELGIQSSEALQSVGDESYQVLVKFVNVKKPWEKKALRRLLNMETSYKNQRKAQKEKLAKRQEESSEFLKVLAKLQKEGKDRHDEEVRRLEEMFRERLQVPEDMWLSKDANLSEVMDRMQAIHSNIGNVSIEKKEENDYLVITRASGGLALRGVLISKDPSDAITPRQHLLRVPEDIKLDGPFKSQETSIEQFESHSMEEQFSKEVETFGYSVSAAAKGGLWGVSFEVGFNYSKNKEIEETKAYYQEKTYASTIRYSFMPLASCTLKEHQLQLSEDSLAHLHKIDKNLSKLSVVREECKMFFQKFGSHAFIGPLHFGGRFMWKSYTSGFKESDREETQALQSEAIGAHASVSYGNIAGASGAINVSSMSGSLKRDYSQTLTSQTFIRIEITGGPPNVTGLADWKNGLVGNSSTWHLIDRGILRIPVWDIIKQNHAHEFQNIILLVATLKEEWQKSFFKVRQEEGVLGEQVKVMVDSVKIWNENPDETKYELQLSTLLDIKERVARQCLNPKTWAEEYLSQQPLKHFIGLVVQSCMRGSTEHSTRLKRYIRQLVEPTDLDITRVFPNEKATLKWLYNTEDPDPPIECYDFLSLNQYFTLALEKIHSENPLLHEKGTAHLPSQLAISVTSTVAVAVFSLRNHLWKTGQVHEDCFLTTMLYPFKYDPEQCLFAVLMTIIDVEYLCRTFSESSEMFFNLMKEKPVPNIQSYLFSLTITLYDNLDVPERYVKGHLKYLQKRLKVCPEVNDMILKLESNNYDWEIFKDELEVFTNGMVIEGNDNGVQLSSLLEEKQQKPNPVQKDKRPLYLKDDKVVASLFDRMALLDKYSNKLTPSDAIAIREDVLGEDPLLNAELYPFRILQKLMAFDHRCRIPFSPVIHKESEADSESDSDSSLSSDDDIIHPMDGLLVLIHCSDNFLRQNLFSRLATCQLAVPLLLPDPITKEPKFLLWALRSIVKEFKVANNILYSGPIINYTAPIVAFLRVGRHTTSKSELLNSVINVTKHATFFHYNCDGGSAERILVNGLVEVSWYLPSKNEEFFSNAITFVNLHGDARELTKQTNFLSEVCSMHFVLLNDDAMVKDGLDEDTGSLLKCLSQAVGGVVVLETHSKSKSSSKAFKKALRESVTRDKKKLDIIKLCEMNESDRKKSIQEKISASLKDDGGQNLENIAEKCCIPLDEDDPHCVRGREEAKIFQSIADEFRKNHPGDPGKSPKSLLILQSKELWHKWAELDKEQRRQQRRGQMSINDYGALLRKRMNKIRKEQLQKAKAIGPLMSSFLSSLRHLQGEVLCYYLQWVKLYFDNLSRMLLPPLHEKYREKREILGDIQMQEKKDEISEKMCRQEMNHLNLEIINASFGMEHLLREISQIYEAVVLQEDAPKEIRDKIICLPKIAAQLLFQGFPIELLDGDASHMPQRWISAVFQCLSEILGDEARVFIISVLGLQSTGKSTLLNTLFGVQFSVSAGRCTRGAFMQLIPVHKSLSKKCGVQYFLIIDTEGLRAPELDTLQTQKHDNELATFVIGMANLTLINVKGEISGDMDDILQTAVHAFLRMKEVNLKPSCHFVHQNIGDVAADEKLVMGRFKMKDKLDGMTLQASKETGSENEISYFSQVIDFNYQEDVSFFPSLWTGSPPMAPVSPAYSTEASTLKHVIIQLQCEDVLKTQSCTIPKLLKHLEEMWKAILQEDFVFSFKNTFEIAAYRSVEDEYEKWSWDFKKRMMQWEQAAESKLKGCTQESLSSVNEQLSVSLPECVSEMYTEYETKMNTFFEKSEEKEIISKWKQNTEARLLHLREKLQRHANNHCNELFQSRKGRAVAERKKHTLQADVLERVEQLVDRLKKQKTKTNEKEVIEREFDKSWIEWMGELTYSVERLTPPNVPQEVENSLAEFFSQKQTALLKGKVLDPQKGGKPLKEWGKHLKLVVCVDHIKLKRPIITTLGVMFSKQTWHIREQFIAGAQIHTDIVLTKVGEYLTKKQESDKNFNPEFTTEMLHFLLHNISVVKSDDFQFSDVFRVEIALTVCGYAIPIFQKMADSFRKKYDPVEYIQSEMKPFCHKLFMDSYNEKKREKIAAETLCQQLQDPIKQYVIRTLSRCVADDMRHNNPWIKSKKSLIGCILLDIGKSLQEKDYNFHDCAMFLKDAGTSMKHWIKYYTAQYCDEGCPSYLSQKVQRELSETIHFITSKANEVCQCFLQGPETFHVSDWLMEFYKICLEGKFNVEYSMLCLFGQIDEFKNIRFFTDEFVNGLDLILNNLKKSLQDLKYSQLIALETAPHDAIFDQVAGCTKQCPFCKAPCEHNNENHVGSVKHTTEHRPRCLGGRKWESNNTMVLDICTSAVASSDCCFRNNDTNQQWHPYKKYAHYYPEWKISPDPSLEASIFWKWLVGHFAGDIEKLFGHSETPIPQEWKSLKWDYVECMVKKSHDLD